MKYIIAGCGRLGSGLALSLSKAGHQVTVINDDPEAFERLGTGFKGRTIIGVPFDRDVLIQAGIERSDGLAAVTNSDETNAVIARIASLIFRVPKVVTRVYDTQKAEIYQRLGLQTIDQNTWGIQRVFEMLAYSPLDTQMSLGGVDLVEVEIPALLVGRKVSELAIPGEISVIAITRVNKAFVPTLNTEFQRSDRVHLSVNNGSRARLRALLGLT